MQISILSRRLFYLLGLFALNFIHLSRFGGISLPGDHMPGVPPVPIPNTAVKPRAANGSWTLGPARVGRCQVYGPVLRKKDRAFFFELGEILANSQQNSAASGSNWRAHLVAANFC